MPAVPLAPDDIRAIQALHDRWIGHELAGQATAILDICDADVVWLPPGARPLRGRETILHWLSGPPVAIQAIEVSHLEIRGQGHTAWKTCEFVTTLQPSPADPPQTLLGAHLWVLAREASGPWRVVAVSWTLR
jgi:ketosteroid isomerase-like protein